MRVSAHCEHCNATRRDCTCEYRCASCGLGFGDNELDLYGTDEDDARCHACQIDALQHGCCVDMETVETGPDGTITGIDEDGRAFVIRRGIRNARLYEECHGFDSDGNPVSGDDGEC